MTKHVQGSVTETYAIAIAGNWRISADTKVFLRTLYSLLMTQDIVD